jgi:hypothetical protein
MVQACIQIAAGATDCLALLAGGRWCAGAPPGWRHIAPAEAFGAPAGVASRLSSSAWCGTDPDGDGRSGPLDNCPALANPDQGNCDGHGVRVACGSIVDPDVNALHDRAEIAQERSRDFNGNRVPDECGCTEHLFMMGSSTAPISVSCFRSAGRRSVQCPTSIAMKFWMVPPSRLLSKRGGTARECWRRA